MMKLIDMIPLRVEMWQCHGQGDVNEGWKKLHFQLIMDLLVNRTSSRTCDVEGGFDGARVTQWTVSRLRTFFYLSNPVDEAFQFADQVTDYHTEVSFSSIISSISFNNSKKKAK